MVEIYLDGPDIKTMAGLSEFPEIRGITTNPTLVKSLGVASYEAFIAESLSTAPPLPISFEVVSEEPAEIVRQAKRLSGFSPRIFVKIPIVSSAGASLKQVIKELAEEGVPLNVTAVFTDKQFDDALSSIDSGVGNIVSVFAGRIADTGTDPVPKMKSYAEQVRGSKGARLLWASPREILNLVQAEATGTDIITLPVAIWEKRHSLGKDLELFSRETAEMFISDAVAAGLEL